MKNLKTLVVICTVAIFVFPALAADGKSGYFLHIQKQAEIGHAWAEKALGDAYYYGISIEQDAKNSVVWYDKAAEQGLADGQYALGRAYYFGEGVESGDDNKAVERYRKAVEWYRKAAEQGHSDAQYALGRMYYTGWFVNEDKKEAAKWYQESNNENAWRDLGNMYLNGEGVEGNLFGAYRAFQWSALRGSKEAEQDLHTIRWSDLLAPSEIKFLQEDFAKELQEETDYEAENISRRIAVASTSIESLSAEKVYERIWRSVVCVEIVDAGICGSGVIIQPNIVATNCHVIEDAGYIRVRKYVDSRGQKYIDYEASPRSDKKSNAYKDRDFCLLDVEDLWGEPAIIRRYDTLKNGERVYALGAPQGHDLSFSTGIISQLREKVKFPNPDDNYHYRSIQSDVDIAGGSSGGGLFDSAGNLIGHTTFSDVDEEIGSDVGLNFSIPADIALDF
ncbi:MAG: tetratricopeptide repeat-containing serine protease family protein [Gammaproteobacteria bacterium]